MTYRMAHRLTEQEQSAAPAARHRPARRSHGLQSTLGNHAVLQRKAQAQAPAGHVPTSIVHQATGNGSSLDGHTRSRMEGAFGADFSGVRLHIDAAADRLSRSLGANALTVGRNIYFRQGTYAPGSPQGEQLLAHELTHVVQQGGGPTPDALTVSQPNDALEIEADRMAAAVNLEGTGLEPIGQRGPALAPQVHSGGVHIQRQGGPAEAAVGAAGLAIAAASFAVSLLPGGDEGLKRQEVVTSRSRPSAASSGHSVTIPILELWGHIAAGSSDATWNLVLETDGDSIIAANTEFASIHGFEGGVLGSSGRVSWGASTQGGSREQPVKILLTLDGFLNPSGPGYCDFNASYIIGGDGTVTRRHCRVSNVSGNIPYTMGWSNWGSSGYYIGTVSR